MMVRFFIICLIVALSSPSYSFEFSNKECEFKVNFPYPVSIKKVAQPLGNGTYSNTYMAKASDSHAVRIYRANCDTSFRLAPGISMPQKRKMVEWSVRQWSKMIGLNNVNMYWEKLGSHITLKMIGRRIIAERGKRLEMAFQTRTYLGRKSMMLVAVGERASISPSAAMQKFLDTSVYLK